jgi:hypothetical protein
MDDPAHLASVDPTEVAMPELEFVFRLTITLGLPLDQGTYEGQRRRIIPILGGTAEGPRFQGAVLPGGADWQTVRVADGVASIYARSTLQHEDGTIVSMVNRGVRRGPAEVMARLAAGELVDPGSYYFRACPQFEVQPGPHEWLAQNVFLCIGKRWPDSVHLDIYKVL